MGLGAPAMPPGAAREGGLVRPFPAERGVLDWENAPAHGWLTWTNWRTRWQRRHGRRPWPWPRSWQ